MFFSLSFKTAVVFVKLITDENCKKYLKAYGFYIKHICI